MYRIAIEKRYRIDIEKRYRIAIEKRYRIAIEERYRIAIQKRYRIAIEKRYRIAIEGWCWGTGEYTIEKDGKKKKHVNINVKRDENESKEYARIIEYLTS